MFNFTTDVILFTAMTVCVGLFIRTLYMILATPVILATDFLPAIYPKISVLLPVRNEASRVLRENVKSLVSQSYLPLEILAIDDRSTDGSSDILLEYELIHNDKLRLMRGHEPPIDWMGKTFALQQAKNTSLGEWLVAVDADVIYSDNIISASLAFALEQHLDALSLLPQVTMIKFWESVIIPAMCWLSLMRVSTTQANRKSSKACFGCGNFILFRRTAHDAIGSFEAYKGDILDDCAIMVLLKSYGFGVMVADGSSLMKTRMYASLKEIILGFGKNTFAALNFSVPRSIATVFGEALFIFFPFAYLLYGLFVKGVILFPSGIMAATASGCFFLTMLVFGLRMGADRRFFLFYLLGHAIATAIILYSMISFLSGMGVLWKDRVIGMKSKMNSNKKEGLN